MLSSRVCHRYTLPPPQRTRVRTPAAGSCRSLYKAAPQAKCVITIIITHLESHKKGPEPTQSTIQHSSSTPDEMLTNHVTARHRDSRAATPPIRARRTPAVTNPTPPRPHGRYRHRAQQAVTPQKPPVTPRQTNWLHHPDRLVTHRRRHTCCPPRRHHAQTGEPSRESGPHQMIQAFKCAFTAFTP